MSTTSYIEATDGSPEALNDDESLWVVSTHRLISPSGEELASWTRCAVGYFYYDGEWVVEEDTEGGDVVPEEVEEILAELGLEDEIPSVPQPAEPEEDPDGGWGLGYTSTDPIGALPTVPGRRYATREDAEKARAAFYRVMRVNYPGGWIAPDAVLMKLDPLDEEWGIESDDGER